MDDSRLARFVFTLDGVRKVWDRPQKLAMLGEPQIVDSLIYLPLRNQVTVYDINGNKKLSIPVLGDITAVTGKPNVGLMVGEESGRISFYNANGKFMWQKQLEGIPQALLVVENRVYVGTSTGQLVIFAP